MGFNCLKATEPLRGECLLFTSKSSGVTGTHLIYLRRVKGQYIFSYFCEPSRAINLCRNFAQLSLIKAVDLWCLDDQKMHFRLKKK